MYEISSSVYRSVADRLMSAIGGKEYFSGSVAQTCGDTEYRLTCTLLVRRDEPATEGRCFRPVTALIPIWWEFHTTVNGEEQLNDFSFKELSEIIFN